MNYANSCNGFRASLEHVRHVCGWESGGGVCVRQEVRDAEAALRWSKAKDYCKILGMCAIGFIAVQC